MILEEQIKEKREGKDLSENGLGRLRSPGWRVGNLSSVKEIVCFDILFQ